MEDNEPPPLRTDKIPFREIDRTYLLMLDNIEYKLSIEYSEVSIKFRIEKNIPLIKDYYSTQFSLKEIISKLFLIEKQYPTIKKVLDLYQKYLEDRKVSLKYDEKKKVMILKLKKILEYDEVECELELNQICLSTNELINMIIENAEKRQNYVGKGGNIDNFAFTNKMQDQINRVKSEIENKQKSLIENLKNELLTEIKNLKDEKEQMKNKYESEINSLKNEIQKIKYELSTKNEIINKMYKFVEQDSKINFSFNNSPEFLECQTEYIENNNDIITPFCVFIPIKNQTELIATYDYKNSKHIIEIYKINNNSPISSLEGHSNSVRSIRYFVNNFSYNDYLISSDIDGNIIIWDISKDYEDIRQLKIKYNGSILSTLLLFNIKNENFIITSSNNESDDYSSVYRFENNTSDKDNCLKKLKNTNKNSTLYLLTWNYKDECYIIELCNKKICVINFEKNKEYANLVCKHEEDYHIRGIIYSDNYLISSSFNGYVRVWDLVSKSLFKTIKINNDKLFGVVHWDKELIIVANYTNNSLDIISLEKEKVIKEIKTPHNDGVTIIEKIYSAFNGNIIVSVAKDKTLRLWSIKK